MMLKKREIIDDHAFIGKNLRKLRKINEQKITEVAEAIGRSAGFISLAEKGRRRVSTNDLRNMLKYYGYSLGRFISDIADSYKDYQYDPEAVVQRTNKRLLLDGSADGGAYGLWLLRPVLTDNESEMLLMNLPANTQMTEHYISLEAEIRGFVLSGAMLIDFRTDEETLGIGDEFLFDGNKPFLFRNYTSNICSALLIINPPAF